MERRLPYQHIWETLAAEKAMVFLAGPRQSGKTTLARIISERFTNNLYVNWDVAADRARIIENPAFFTGMPRRDASTPLVVFDEIHKYRHWKNYLKGIHDQYAGEYRFLVTGSGRLDLYQKGGDSLAGRYLLFHLWPFTLCELAGARSTMEAFRREPLHISLERRDELRTIWSRLETLSGFPEPYLRNRGASYRRWSGTYSRQLVREDIRDLGGIRSAIDVETLYHLLPSKVGSPLSVPSLAQDLKVAYNTVQSWLALFERFFLTFSLPTWTARVARAVHKERKVYLLDAPRVEDPAARFENLVAIELWGAVSCWNAMGDGDFSLHFVRNKEKQEADFLIVEGRKPLLLIETKLADEQPSKSLIAIQRQLGVPAVQLVQAADAYRTFKSDSPPLLVAPAWAWLAGLPGFWREQSSRSEMT